uniref:RING-type domain-containing protein n=1 Tax=Taeniopygia guttata TaxID=59729 RepID=A0A674HET7_TAEGU
DARRLNVRGVSGLGENRDNPRDVFPVLRDTGDGAGGNRDKLRDVFPVLMDAGINRDNLRDEFPVLMDAGINRDNLRDEFPVLMDAGINRDNLRDESTAVRYPGISRAVAFHSRPQPPSHLPQQPCAVCLEDFGLQEELGVLPCQHAFHRECLLKWLEVRCVCPMCNEPRAPRGSLLDELV